jgi:PKD repeat protein
LNPRTGIAITGPTTAIPAGTPASFQVNVNAQANIRDVRVNWGDGTQQSLGALSAQTPVTHIFTDAGSFTVTATAVDAAGFTETVATTVTVLPAQPPSVLVQPSNSQPFVNEEIVVRATVSGNTSSIIRYEWNFGSGTNGPQTISTTGNQVTVSWNTASTKTISVTAFQAAGPSGNGFASVTVRGTAVQAPK